MHDGNPSMVNCPNSLGIDADFTPLESAPALQSQTQAQKPHQDTQPTVTKPKAPPRTKTASHLVTEAQGKDLDELIKLVAKEGIHSRLTAEDELELNNAYMEYQKQLYLIAYKNKLKISPCLQYVGEGSNPRVSSNYNNFCRYDTVASVIHNNKSMHVDDRKRECGRLWKKLDLETQLKWKEPDFIETLVEPNVNPLVDDDNTSQAKRRKKPVSFDTDRWANKVVVDMRKLSRRYGIEGFVVIGSRGKDGAMKYDGGSHLGERFLDMYSAEDDPVTDFIDFIKGCKAVRKITGNEPLPTTEKKKQMTKPRQIITIHDKGSKKANIKFIRGKLNDAIEQATHGKITKGWPGTNTQATLKKHNVVLQVTNNDLKVTPLDFCQRPGGLGEQQAQRVVAALEENLVQLVGPPPPVNHPVGAEADTTDTTQPAVYFTRVSVGQCKGKLPKVKTRVTKSNTASSTPNKKRKRTGGSGNKQPLKKAKRTMIDDSDKDDEEEEEEEEQEESEEEEDE